MKIIAIEEHFLSPEVRTSWAAQPNATHDPGASLHQGEILEKLQDLNNQRLARMDESGVTMQVLSLTSPGLHNVEPAAAPSLARHTNDLIAATIARYPDRVDGFATIPTTAPHEAVKELERSVLHLGLKGGMLFGRTGDKNLDHPDFWPLFETAARLRIPLFIHPQIPPPAVRQAYYSGFDPQVELAFSCFGIGWHYDCGIQFLRLALAGVFDRFPDLQIILGHWGELVLFYTDRLKALARVTKLQRSVVDTMRQNLYVTASGMFNETYFRHALEIVGIDRILFSTDDPYQYRPGGGPKQFLEQLPISHNDKEKIAHANWTRLTAAIRR
jgi:predicted TIM-barrel fold metal-dependent hydrolase